MNTFEVCAKCIGPSLDSELRPNTATIIVIKKLDDVGNLCSTCDGPGVFLVWVKR